MAKIEPFEQFFTDYEEWFEIHPKVYEAEIKAIEKLLGPFEYAIEIGVGSGRFALPFGIKMGVEPSNKMAEISKSKGIEIIEGIAESLPCKDNSFDFTLMVTTICFVDDALKSLKEMYRILRPGGFCIIGLVDINSNIGKIYRKNRLSSRFYKEATFFTTKEVMELLSKAGFDDIKCYQTLFGDSIENVETSIKSGYGEGAFIAIRADKK